MCKIVQVMVVLVCVCIGVSVVVICVCIGVSDDGCGTCELVQVMVATVYES